MYIWLNLRKLLENLTFLKKNEPFQKRWVLFIHYAADFMLGFNQIMVDSYAALFITRRWVRSDSLTASTKSLKVVD